MGGTIKKLTDEGHEVFIFWLGSGRPARTFGEQTEQDKVKQSVLNILGAKELIGVGGVKLEDNEFDKVSLLSVIQKIETAISVVNPSILFSHSEKCLNLDHVITAKAVKTAVARRGEIKELYAFEVLSSTEWNHPDTFKPNVFIDISATLDDKLKALDCYKEEMRDYPHPRSIEIVKSLAMYRGSMAGLKAAEAFEAIRLIK